MNSPVWFSAKCHFAVLISTAVVLVFATDDVVALKSFVFGGLIYAVPNLYFVHYAFRFQGAQHVPLVLRSFSWGESGKFALAAIGFVLAFRFVAHLSYATMFAGFIVMMIVQWFIAAALVKRRDESEIQKQKTGQN